LINSIFLLNGPLSNIYKPNSPAGYFPPKTVYSAAALARGQTGVASAAGNIMSGFAASRASRLVQKSILME
jgi:hypothetical protein